MSRTLRVSVDTETTGLLTDPSTVPVEVAFAGPPGIQFSSLVAPQAPLTGEHWRILETISHFTVDDLLGAPSPSEVRREILVWYRAIGSPPVDGFSLPFDRGMVDRVFPDLPLRWGVDYQPIANQFLNVDHRLSLTDARVGVNLPAHAGAHRALADARATWELGEALSDPWWDRIPILLPDGRIAPTPAIAALWWARAENCSPTDPALIAEVRRRIPDHLIR